MRHYAYLLAVLPLQLVSASQSPDTTIVVTEQRTITICPLTQLNICEDDSVFDPTAALTSGPIPTVTADVTRHWSNWYLSESTGKDSSASGKSTSSSLGAYGSSTGKAGGSSASGSGKGSTSAYISGSATGTGAGSKSSTSTKGTGTHVSSSTTASEHGDAFTTRSTRSSASFISGSTTSTSSTNPSATGSTTTHSAATSLISTTTTGAEDGRPSTTTTGNYSSTTGFGNGTTSATTSAGCGTSTPEALKEIGCNTPEDRSKWCTGKSIETDTHTPFFSGSKKLFELTITNTTLDFDGQMRHTFAINGQSPGPAIEVNWGDMVEIVVTNLLEHNATTIHWHGIRQLGTNDQDGVPGVTECGIAPGTSRVYRWHASTYGTGWYHSHLLSQYGGGIRGPIIIHGPATANYDYDMGTVMIDDIFEASIFQMAWRTSHTGAVNTTNYLLNGKNVAPDMSRGEHQKWTIKKGKKHLFRIINSSGQNAYAVHFDSHTMTVIAADFTPIVPYETDWLYITNGQRFDVIINANQPVSSYFLRAVTQTGCPSICNNNGLGLANGIIEYQGDCSTFPTSDLANATVSSFSGCKDEPLSKLKPWVKKTAGTESDLRAQLKLINGTNAALAAVGTSGRIFRWFLNGNTMNVTYTQPTLKTLATVPQSHTGVSLSNAMVLNTASAETWVYFVIQNSFQVSHPMHLHGHDFSILGSGPGFFDASMIPNLNFDNPIRRDTSFLFGSRATPSGYTVIGFQTDNPGAWIMHCHIIWHAEGGMALQYIERPDQIASYWDKLQFKEQCDAMDSYQALGDHTYKHEYESGLKRAVYEGMMGARENGEGIYASFASEQKHQHQQRHRGSVVRHVI